MKILEYVNFTIAVVFTVCYLYQFIYIPVAFAAKSRHYARAGSTGMLNRYAVLICARNESAVISELLESLRAQTYPAENLTVFVMADNCTDSTASIARRCGAIVYERFNSELVGKGYALDELLQNIKCDYGDVFDAFFVFDADNILERDYIEQMDRTFCDGYEIVTSYRNSKNYGDNWISAGYALWFLRESRYLNHARQALGTSCAVSGTGFMFSRGIMLRQGGWPYHLLTEDIEFSVSNIIDGERIGFCPDAVLYDEQPTSFRQSWRQRMRWAKGYLQVFARYGSGLTGGIFRGKFSCFDMSMAIMPAIVLTVIGFLASSVLTVSGVLNGEDVLIALRSVAQNLSSAYLMLFAIGFITTLTEWTSIRTSSQKKLLYTLTFPLFMLTYIPISFCALFARVTWKPIEHRVSGRALLEDDKPAA